MTLAVLLVPLVTALLLPLLPRGLQVGAALLAALATFALALFLPGAAGVSVPWLPALGATLTLHPGGAASVLVLTASLAMVAAVVAAARGVRERRGAFLALLLGMQAMLNGLFLSKDLLLTYVFWEATLLPSLFLLGAWGLERRARAVGKYLTYAVAGSFLMLVSILALRPLSGAASYRIEDLLAAAPTLTTPTQTWLFAGFALAFAVKLPLWPLHSWLVDFHDQNHPSGAADIAGTLYKVGGFGFFAWAIPLLPDGAAVMRPLLLTLAAVTALYGGLAATRQRDLKRLFAYASLSHMGVVGAGVFSLQSAGLSGAMALLAAQMVSTGALFLLAGMLHERTGTFALDAYGGVARSAPGLAAVALFVTFAAIGVPGLSNFPGEFLALMGAVQANVGLGVLAAASVIAAAAYGVNLYARVFQGPPAARLPELRPAEALALAPLLAGILWLGLAPAPSLERIEAQPGHAGAALEAPAPAASEPPLAVTGGDR